MMFGGAPPQTNNNTHGLANQVPDFREPPQSAQDQEESHDEEDAG